MPLARASSHLHPVLPLALLLLLGASPASAAQSSAYVVTSDYSTGGLSVVNLATRSVASDVATVYSDAAIRTYDGKIYVINRFGQDNIQVLDPVPSVHNVLQFSTGSGTNPQDIAFLSPTKAFVSLYNRQAVLVCDPTTGATLDTISLAQFADSDHLPEMARMAMVGSHLFVALQRLDRNNNYQPTNQSLVAVIDAVADTVIDTDPITPGVQAIGLTFRNPVTTFSYVPATRRLLIGCAGVFGIYDGGIEAIDVDALHSLGTVSTEGLLGGDIGDIEWYSPTHSYAIVSDIGFNSVLISFNPSGGPKIATIHSPGGFSLPDCALNDRGELYVADNGFASAGIYIYHAGNDSLLAGPLDTGLPPNQIAFDTQRDEVAAAPPPAIAELGFSAPRPNPACTEVAFTLDLAAAAAIEVAAFDLAGRRVATLAAGARPAGRVGLSWNLRGAAGERLAPGVYLVRARAGDRTFVRRLAIVR